MNLLLFIFGTIAITIAVYPYKKQRINSIILAVILALYVAIAYLQWGGGSAYTQHEAKMAAKKTAMRLLSSVDGKKILIDKLRHYLSTNPHDTKAWYLLGKLYLSINNIKDAKLAFKHVED